MTDFERLMQRVQARRVAMAYSARNLELPDTVAEILADDTPERHAADNVAWRQWCSDHGLRPILQLARSDTILLEGDMDFEPIWRYPRQDRSDRLASV
jgi:hypothetical protein